MYDSWCILTIVVWRETAIFVTNFYRCRFIIKNTVLYFVLIIYKTYLEFFILCHLKATYKSRKHFSLLNNLLRVAVLKLKYLK